MNVMIQYIRHITVHTDTHTHIYKPTNINGLRTTFLQIPSLPSLLAGLYILDTKIGTQKPHSKDKYFFMIFTYNNSS